MKRVPETGKSINRFVTATPDVTILWARRKDPVAQAQHAIWEGGIGEDEELGHAADEATEVTQAALGLRDRKAGRLGKIFGRGLCVGRNVFQSSDPMAVLADLHAMLCGDEAGTRVTSAVGRCWKDA